jgi:hypothetical protein
MLLKRLKTDLCFDVFFKDILLGRNEYLLALVS